jgi:hypothetical protein
VPTHEKKSVQAFAVKYQKEALAEWERLNERDSDDEIETKIP